MSLSIRILFYILLAGFPLTSLCAQEGDTAERSIPMEPVINQQDLHREAAEVERTVQDVLTSPEYRHLIKTKETPAQDNEFTKWLEGFLKWFFGEPKEAKEPAKALFDLGQALYYLALLILFVLLVILIVSSFRWMNRTQFSKSIDELQDEEAITPTRPAGDLSTNEYEQRALTAMQTGDFRKALRELVLGAMSWTERGGFIRYRLGLTNRDYIRAIWRHPEQRESLMKIVLDFERVFYGNRQADAATVEACLSEFRSSFLLEADHATLAS